MKHSKNLHNFLYHRSSNSTIQQFILAVADDPHTSCGNTLNFFCFREKKLPIVMVLDPEKSSMTLISRYEPNSECTAVTDADAESKPLSQQAAAEASADESTHC